MDTNALWRWRLKEKVEVIQLPDKRIRMKLPGELETERWNYRDNPWNGIGEIEHIDIILQQNNSPWELTI